MKPNLVWGNVGRVSVVVHGSRAPTMLEWEKYINYARGNVDIRNLRVLVKTHGGSPDAAQRKLMEDMARQQYPEAPPLAMITGSLVVRAVMTLVRVANPHIRCFPPEQLSIAYAYLNLEELEVRQTGTKLKELERQVL